ncbi:bystin [Perkinsela sp. CCAP 1560/4]|nr:bystin [Perkinsela sp. CCAP 1560/4]|eukprot:KNH06376.1 bystin [Perkinsela sp. CCAP 1560/4]
MRRSLRIERKKEVESSKANESESEEDQGRTPRRKRHRQKPSRLPKKIKKLPTPRATQKPHPPAMEREAKYASPVIVTEPMSFGKTAWNESKRSTRDIAYVASATSQHWIQCASCMQWFRTVDQPSAKRVASRHFAGEAGNSYALANRPFQCGCRVSAGGEHGVVVFLEKQLTGEAPRLLLTVPKPLVDAVISETQHRRSTGET